MAELYEFAIDGISPQLLVVRFQGTEQLNRLFHFDVIVSCEDKSLDMAAAVGAAGTLTIKLGEGERHVHGMVLRFQLETAGKKRSYYRVTLVPEMWKAHKNREIRIFQEKNAAEIIDEVVGGVGLSMSSHEMQTQGSYGTREYCVQYRESDWAFISRLMEEEGIFCYFAHEAGSHKLVFSDSLATCASVGAPVIYREESGGLAHGEHVSRFRFSHAMRPDLVSLVDYNFKNPSLNLATSAEGEGGSGIEVYDYPGNYVEPGRGSGLATARAEQWQVAGATGNGNSTCVRLAAGSIFTLSEHPTDLDGGYLLVSVTHRGAQPDAEGEAQSDTLNYTNEFLCIPDSAPYRPAPITPKPTINGVQTAIVTGPAGEEIHTDEHGRVKVHFHWDRIGKFDEHSSCWIRVSQVWAGAGWGGLHIPRIGQEVVVSFVEGDPDRPLITGRVYHGTNIPPYRLPAEKTKSTLKSDSTIGGGGSNELMFEDAKGSEEIYLHGQKDWTIQIENDKNQTVGHNETLQVANNRDKTVGNDQSETIGGNKSINVSGAHTETIAMAEVITVGLASTHTIGGAFVEAIGAAKSSTVAGSSTENVGATKEVKIGGKRTETVASDATLSVGGNREMKVTGNYQATVDGTENVAVKGDSEERIDKTKTINAGDMYSLVVGKGKVTVKKDGTILIEGKDITVKGSGNLTFEGKKLDVKTDSTVNVKAGGAVKIKGSAVDVN